MTGKPKHLSLRIDEDLLRKFEYVAKYDDRSMNWYLLHLIKNEIADFEEKFADALWEGKDPFFDVVLLPLFGSCGESFGVEVIARTRRIFEGETQGIYQVLAKDVFYKQDADEVEMGQFDGKDCLYVRYGNKVHKVVCQPTVIGAKLQLIE